MTTPCETDTRRCPMESKDFINRMAKIEAEIRESRDSRHNRNQQVNNVIDEMRIEQIGAEKRIAIMEAIMQRVTQLLEGYLQQQGLVGVVAEHGLRINAIEKKIYIAVGGLAVLQIIIGMGVFVPMLR